MSKLSEEELIDKLSKAFSSYLAWARQADKRNINGTLLAGEQAYQQIKEMIQASTNLRNKSLGRLAQDLGVSFSATKIIHDHAQPQVTEEFIEEWAEKLYRRFTIISKGLRDEYKDFIRSLVEEVK